MMNHDELMMIIDDVADELKRVRNLCYDYCTLEQYEKIEEHIVKASILLYELEDVKQ